MSKTVGSEEGRACGRQPIEPQLLKFRLCVPRRVLNEREINVSPQNTRRSFLDHVTGVEGPS